MERLKLISAFGLIILSLAMRPAYMAASAATPGTCSRAALSPGTTEQSLTSGGTVRTVRVHIPRSYTGREPIPLVVSLHGFASSGSQQETYSGWSTLADKEGFIAVFPNGTGTPPRWYAGGSSYIGSSQIDDVAFFKEMFDVLDKAYCIDDARIFVNGLSNGGGMTNRLACEMADRIAAVGTVAGAYSPLRNGCQPARPIPVVAFHGDADPIVKYDGAPLQGFPPIKDWVADWAKRNGCNKGPDTVFTQGEVTGIAYSDCQQNADVQFYIIAGGGHTWPGSFPIPLLGRTTADIDATQTMWKFFSAHPLPERP